MKRPLAFLFALALVSAVYGCSSGSHPPTAPSAPSTSTAKSLRAPEIDVISARATASAVHVTAGYALLGRGTAPRFAPQTVGGWCFQVFLNVDQQSTGYGKGMDYLVRGVEVLPGGQVYVRKTEGGQGPGGWGEPVGRVAVELSAGSFSFALPLDMVDDDGLLDLVIELYAAVPGYAGTVRHEFVANYRSSSVRVGETVPVTKSGQVALAEATLRRP